MNSDPRPQNLAGELALLLLLAMLWGASYTLIRIGVSTIPPITLIAARTAIAGIILWTVMHLRGVRFPRDAANWRRFLFQACLNSVIPWTLLAFAERTLEAGLATILNSTSPIFAVLLSLGVSRCEALTTRKLFGVLSGMAGICLIVGVQALAGFGVQLTAQILTVLAAVCYAGAALFGRGFKDLDPIAPGAGSLFLRRGDPHSGKPVDRAALGSRTVDKLRAGAHRSCGVLDRARIRDLFSADIDVGISRDHGAGIFARSGRRPLWTRVPWRTA